jgi:hypothetical protein
VLASLLTAIATKTIIKAVAARGETIIKAAAARRTLQLNRCKKQEKN